MRLYALKYSNDPVINGKEIVQNFINNKFPFRPQTVKNNRVFFTDVSTSTLAFVEDNVVFELYYMHPNSEVVMHSHPFKLTSIFMSGDVDAMWTDTNGITHRKKIPTYEFGQIRNILPEHTVHGFRVGELGAIFYTIQIWNNVVTDPKSATEEYSGDPLGPIHSEQIKK